MSVRAVLDRTCHDGTPVRVEHVAEGYRKRTVRATCSDGTVVAIQHCPVDRGRFDVEGALYEAVAARTDVPVPRVRNVDTVADVAFLVTDWVDGVVLHERFSSVEPSTRVELARTLGRHLGDVHATFVFDAHGVVGLSDGDPAVVNGTADWRTYFRDLVDRGLEAFRGPLTDLVPAIRAAIDANCRAVPSAPTPRLFPWDYRPGNVLVNDDTVVAVLDWEEPLAAHREFSLAKAEYLLADWYGEREAGREAVREAFYDGYEDVLPVPDAYWDERRRPYRLGAIVRTAFDASGAVTRPRYPMVDPEAAAAFHREHVRALL